MDPHPLRDRCRPGPIPAGLALLCVTSATGIAVGPAAFAFFALVCVQQVTDITLTDGTTRTSINATYQALLPRLRLQAQTMTEAAGIPIALGLVGVLLIVQDALDLDVRAVLLVTIVLTAIWSIFAVVAYREYGANLRDVLSRRAWDPVAIRIDDDVSQSLIESLLSSGSSETWRRRSKPWLTPAAPLSRLTSPS